MESVTTSVPPPPAEEDGDRGLPGYDPKLAARLFLLSCHLTYTTASDDRDHNPDTVVFSTRTMGTDGNEMSLEINVKTREAVLICTPS